MSRNQREGRFIPGWCYNPSYHSQRDKDGNLVQKIRAGKHFDLKVMYNKQMGKTYFRVYREGAFE
jgi:hypothetical protein